MGLVRSTDLNLYWIIREKAEKSWLWHEVHIWYRQNNHGFCVKYIFEFVLIYIEWGRKIMGLARSTDLNSYICKRKGRKIMGLSRSTHLVSHNSITGISRKIMGLARSTDLNSYNCKGNGKKIMGLSRSTHLISHNSIKEISRKIMGFARSTDLNL